MKIVEKDAVYVQKGDLASLLYQEKFSLPDTVMNILFKKGNPFYVDNNNAYEFVKFIGPEEIEYFKSLDWIIDYNEYKNYTKEEIEIISNNILTEAKNLAKNNNEMVPSEKARHQDIVEKCTNLDNKIYSLKLLYLYKTGVISFSLPDGVEEIEIEKVSKEETKPMGRVKSFFKKLKLG